MYEFFPSVRQLRTFAAVAQSQSISRASAELYLSQSAVTQAIAKLETELDASLFVRRNKGTYLTDLGRILQRRIERFFGNVEAALAAVGDDASAARGPTANMTSRRITRTQMIALVAINETGSFMQAARHIGVSLPSLHRSARALQDHLQSAIFHNTAHGVTTNEQGARLASRLLLASRELEWAREEIEAEKGIVRGRILVGALMLAGSYLLASGLGRFLSAYPQARVAVVNGSYDVLLNKLRMGSLDFVIGLLKSPPPADDVVEEVLLTDRYVVAARRGHPLAGKPHCTRADLAGFDWISPTPAAARRATYENMLGKAALPRSNVETHSLATILLLLANSDRLALLTQSELQFDRRLGHHLTALNFGPIDPPAEIGVTMRRSWLLTQLQCVFLDFLRRQPVPQAAEEGGGASRPSGTRLDVASIKNVIVH